MQMKIKVHASLLSTATDSSDSRGWLTGLLYLQIGEEFFPTEGGGDYVLLNLGFWMENAMRLMLPESEVENTWRENSYTFDLIRSAGSDDVILRLYDNRGQMMSKHVISYRRYLAALRGAAKSLLNEIEEKGLPGGALTNNLRDKLTHVERLESHIKEHGLP
jgi:hypothetical protein